MTILALDAGHGQDSRSAGVFDSGAVHGNENEDERAFQLVESALYVASLPEFNNRLRCVLTRDTRQESAPVGGRDEEAEREGADIMISVHLNSADGAQGTETYYRDAVDKSLAAKVNAAAVAAFGLVDRGVKSESMTRHKRLAVMDFDGPVCLWEAGFMESGHDMGQLFGNGSRARRIDFWSRVYRSILPQTKARAEL